MCMKLRKVQYSQGCFNFNTKFLLRITNYSQQYVHGMTTQT
jgi:hypothetical protein